jgi:hypothetical protein
MKIIDIIQVNEEGSPLRHAWGYVGNGIRDIGSWGLERVANLIGRGANWRKAEIIAPEIITKETSTGRNFTRDQIEKHIVDTDPLVRNALDEAQRAKQAYIDHQYTVNPATARARFGTADPPVARLTQTETDTILSKPEFKPSKKLVDEVEHQVNTGRSEARRTQATRAVQPLKDGVKTLFKIGIPASVAVQVIAPFTEYYEKVKIADEWLATGKPPDDGHPAKIKTVEAWYVWYCDSQLGEAIIKSGTAFALGALGVGAAKLIIPGMIKWMIPGEQLAKNIAAGVEGGTILLGSAFLAKLFSEENNAAFGGFFANFLGYDVNRVVGNTLRAMTGNGPYGEATREVLHWAGKGPVWVAEIVRQWIPLFGSTTGADDLQKRAQGKPVDKPAATTTPGGATVSGDWN